MNGLENKVNYYLIGEGNKIYGYALSKYDAQLICKQRKGYRYKKLKAKNAEQMIHNSTFSEVVCLCGTNICMFMDEENYFLESFTQYHFDTMRTFQGILDRLKFLKYNSEDEKYISLLISDMYEYNEGMGHGTLYDADNDFDNQFWDYGRAAKWFLRNVIKVKLREEYIE